jgi:thioredoxin-like negative regulator of GroEL
MSLFRKHQDASISAKGNVIDLNEAIFVDVVSRNDLAIVMFCRQGCPHCSRMEPLYQELSEEMADRVLFGRVDILSNVALTRKYGISGTPTFKLMKRGSVVGSVEGECPKDLLKAELIKQF